MNRAGSRHEHRLNRHTRCHLGRRVGQALAALIVLTGCAQAVEPSSASSPSVTSQRVSTSDTASSAVDSPSPSVTPLLKQHDAPPDGVPELLTYSPGGGPRYCPEDTGGPPRLVFVNERLEFGFGHPAPGATGFGFGESTIGEVGWDVSICMVDVPEGPVDVAIFLPDGQRLSAAAYNLGYSSVRFTALPGGFFRIYVYAEDGYSFKVGTMTGPPVGTYRAEVSAGALQISGSWEMHRATYPRLVLLAPHLEDPVILAPGGVLSYGLVGVTPQRSPILALYADEGDGSAYPVRFMALVQVTADLNGEIVAELPIPEDAEKTCSKLILNPAEETVQGGWTDLIQFCVH